MITYKPRNYNSVSPYLVLDGAENTIQFLKSVFGAVELLIIPDGMGKIIHAELRIDDTVVMMADSFPPEFPAQPAHVHIYVEDVDAIYQKALAAGAVRIQEPVKKHDENKRGAVKDSGGTTWWISTKVG